MADSVEQKKVKVLKPNTDLLRYKANNMEAQKGTINKIKPQTNGVPFTRQKVSKNTFPQGNMIGRTAEHTCSSTTHCQT